MSLLDAAQFICLLAQNDASRMPLPKAILLFVLCLGIGLGSCVGVFASNATLQSFSGIIGTSNPLIARTACAIGAFVGLLGAFCFGLLWAGAL